MGARNKLKSVCYKLKTETEYGPFFIARDIAGNCVLRVGAEDGEELFSDELDNGAKNKKHERVRNAILLMQKIGERSAAADS